MNKINKNIGEVNRNQLLNFLKGLGCIGVVFIHITFPGLTGEIVSKISQFAVPVFFMTAGYYAMGCSEKTIKRRLIKILKIFIYGYLWFLTYNILLQIKGGGVLIEWLVANYTIKSLVKYVIFCNIDFAVPLWYLIAMLETYILWYFVVKWKKENLFVYLIPLLFLFQLLLTIICETNEYAWFWKMNFLSRGLAWFLFGYYVCSVGKEAIDKKKDVVLAICAIVGCVVALIPVVLDTSIDFSCVGLLFFSIALFVIAVKHSSKVVCKPIAYIGDKLSLNIYIFHMLMGGSITLVLKSVFEVNTDSNIFLWAKPILTVVATVIFSQILYKCKQYFVLKSDRKNSRRC